MFAENVVSQCLSSFNTLADSNINEQRNRTIATVVPKSRSNYNKIHKAKVHAAFLQYSVGKGEDSKLLNSSSNSCFSPAGGGLHYCAQKLSKSIKEKERAGSMKSKAKRRATVPLRSIANELRCSYKKEIDLEEDSFRTGISLKK